MDYHVSPPRSETGTVAYLRWDPIVRRAAQIVEEYDTPVTLRQQVRPADASDDHAGHYPPRATHGQRKS
jgi:hypothetical protein